MQEGQRLLAILYIADAALMLAPGQRLACQNNVGRVVIHEKDLRQLFHRSGSPLLVVTTGRERGLKNGTTVILNPHPYPSTAMFGERQQSRDYGASLHRHSYRHRLNGLETLKTTHLSAENSRDLLSGHVQMDVLRRFRPVSGAEPRHHTD